MPEGFPSLFTFRAGKCELKEGREYKCLPEEGLIYLYATDEEELPHFCWRKKSAPPSDPEIDLVCFPGDSTFRAYTGKTSTDSSIIRSPTKNRLMVFKFSSSSDRHLFWMQAQEQYPDDPGRFSRKDLKCIEIVNQLLSAEPGDVTPLVNELYETEPDEDDDEDEDMIEPPARRVRTNSSTGGAGTDATGADFREEGEESREGGGDGARAPQSDLNNQANSLIQNLLRSLPNSSTGSQQTSSASQPRARELYTTLNDLLTPETTTPIINNASAETLDKLLAHLPLSALTSSSPSTSSATSSSSSPSSIATATTTNHASLLPTIPLAAKRTLLTRLMHAPQFRQSLSSLTQALQEGGLPTVSAALDVSVPGGGFMGGTSAVPLGGGLAVRAFLEGVRSGVVVVSAGSAGKDGKDGNDGNSGAGEDVDMTE